MLKRLVLLALPLLLFSAGTTFAQTEKISEVEKNLTGRIIFEGDAPMNLQERMAFYKIKGLSMAVIQNYKIIWAKGYGWADEDKKIPVTTQTLFQAASISKSLNAVGVLKLVQDKKLDLYTDINTYLTSWKFPYDSLSKGKKINMANLLSHTGGLTVHGFGGYEQGKEIPSIGDILDGKNPATSPAVRSLYEPGIKYEYSGGGITISQQIIADITHMPYDKYMDEQILKPMGMTSSTYTQPPLNKNPEILATAYFSSSAVLPGKFHVYPEQAAAGLWTNPTDLAAYIIETQKALEGKSHKVLNQATTRTRLTPYVDKAAALGVFIDSTDGTKYFQHGGSNAGFKCQYYGSLEGGNGIVIMVNSDNSAIISELVNSAAKVYGLKGLNKTIVKKRIVLEDAILDTYIGQYALTPSLLLTITKENGGLVTQATGQQKINIYAEDQTKFFAVAIDAKLEFIKDAAGKVVSVILYQNGGQREAKRVK